MKKNLLELLIALLLPLSAMADSYPALWKKVDEARQKDLPKTEMHVLDQIISKAGRSGDYGQLLKAQLMRSATQTQISPDSADVELQRIETIEQQAKDPVLKAVYATVLGKLYEQRDDDDAQAKSQKWFAQAMSNPALLAAHKSAELEPALVKGSDSRIFYDDLLHAIGMETGNYQALHDYYLRQGNRAAACICASFLLQQDRQADTRHARKSKYLQRVDSLIHVYSDLREAGELAIEHYRFLEGATDATTKDRIAYINYALSKWGAWPRMNILRNAQSDLERPSYVLNVGDYMMLPQVKRKVMVNAIRNISTLTVNIYRVNISGDTHLDPTDKGDYAKLQKKLVTTPVQTLTRRYIGQPAWKENTDSLIIDGLPVGVYLMEATTDNSSMAPQRTLLRVSDLYVMHLPLPGKQLRLVAVNATTGKPVAGAHLRLTTPARYDQEKDTQVTLTTDKNGEALCTYQQRAPRLVYAYTDEDKACGEFDLNTYYQYWNNKGDAKTIKLFTDRSIYRPGQQVHVAAIAYLKDDAKLKTTPLAGSTLKLTLHDANGKEVSSQTVSTDSYGTASADFTLPQSGLTGRFSVRSEQGGWTSFSVEEYKRPTYQVSFDAYKESYQAGDTVKMRGVAKTYAGMPVQGGKVSYTVSRRPSFWWSWRNSGEETLMTDSATTADDGSFTVKMPMTFPDDADLTHPVYYNITVNAQVTDAGGESHEATASLPLSNRSSLLTTDLPGKVLRDSLKTFTLTRRNIAGETIDGTVSYHFDQEPWHTAQANTPITLAKHLSSGRHLLEAVCGQDTLKQQVVVFSYSDKKPAYDTHDWYYLSAEQFPNDGKPVYLQYGTSDEETHVYYTVFSGNTILAKGERTLHNEVYTQKLNYKPQYGDGITIALAWVHHGKLYQHSARITRPVPDNHLQLSWTTFRDKLTPGQKEQWTLHIAAPDGKAAQAQLLATMYDKSLDAIQKHQWNFNLSNYLSVPYAQWHGGSNATVGLYGFQDYKALSERDLDFTHFDPDMFDFANPYTFRYTAPVVMHAMKGRLAGVNLRAMAKASNSAHVEEVALSAAADSISSDEDADSENGQGNASAGNEAASNGNTQIRENLNETAFFYPALTTDAKGNVNISFTLPESVTTWRMMGLAHDRDFNYGQVSAEAVASKTVMVQPNMPRFLRLGDKGQITARLFNTSDKTVHGKVRLEIIDPESMRTVSSEETTFDCDANASTTASFEIQPSSFTKSGNTQSVYIARIVAEGRGFSDGEQHYLPILPDREYITTTLPFTQNGAGTKSFDISKLFPGRDKANKLTVEYTNNPAWLMIQALPTVANPREKNAISMATAIYANTLGRQLINSDPTIAQTLKQWQQEKGSETSLMSSLEKDASLKSLVLSETPWVADADHETAQKQQLINFLDANTIDYRLQDFTRKLQALQNPDGSFSWWPGMRGNDWMTIAVTDILTRLNVMTGQKNNEQLLDRSFSYLDRHIAKEVAEMKKQKAGKKVSPSEWACQYLYASALAGRPQTADIRYLVGLLDKMPTELTIYGKAAAAVILAQYGHTARAEEYLQSLNEYAVYKEDLGRYFDTRKAYYSWRDYRIPTQVAAIEAMKRLMPQEVQTIEEMQRWLLQEKRTQAWDTPLNTVDAVYAFLADKEGKADMSRLNSQPATILKVDGKPLELPKATAGLGYVKTAVENPSLGTFTAEKTSDGTSWGALYAQYWQSSTDVDTHAAGLQVKREIIVQSTATGASTGKEGNASAEKSNSLPALKVGDKVCVRITITADRDYDFVQVQDKRAACLEPVGQLSGYHWGYYCAPQDNVTNYYFDRMAKGKHVVETAYYVDRPGDYATGICTAQCAYSPEFSGREGAKTITVK